MAAQPLGEARCAAVLGDGRAVSFLVVFHSTHVCFKRDFYQDRHRLLSDTFLSSIRMIAGFPLGVYVLHVARCASWPSMISSLLACRWAFPTQLLLRPGLHRAPVQLEFIFV